MQIDAEITWHDEERLRQGSETNDDDQFTEVFTEFYNWASERKEFFDEALDQASSVLARAHAHARHASICVGYVRGDTSW